jgi:ATP-dependent helicase/nuclease subunit A
LIVHELIEKLYKDKLEEIDVDDFLSQQGYSFGLEDITFIKKCLENFVSSGIYNIPGEVFSEIPFAYRVNSRWLLTGKADLLVFEDDGATIVDFKTNTQIHPNLLEIYRLQVLTYALAISNIYNVEPKRAIVASLFEGNFTQIEMSPSILAECNEQILCILDRIESGAFQDKARDAVTCNFCAYKNMLCKLL